MFYPYIQKSENKNIEIIIIYAIQKYKSFDFKSLAFIYNSSFLFLFTQTISLQKRRDLIFNSLFVLLYPHWIFPYIIYLIIF